MLHLQVLKCLHTNRQIQVKQIPVDVILCARFGTATFELVTLLLCRSWRVGAASHLAMPYFMHIDPIVNHRDARSIRKAIQE